MEEFLSLWFCGRSVDDVKSLVLEVEKERVCKSVLSFLCVLIPKEVSEVFPRCQGVGGDGV